MTLKEALQIQKRELISLVGGGGKTSLMFALGRELADYGRGIVLTTTTKIWKPSGSAVNMFLSDHLPELKKWVARNLLLFPFIILAQRELSDGKLQGLPLEWVDELFSLEEISYILVEADGAAGRSLKAPKEGEPVIPQKTSLLIPVVGIDIFGVALAEEYVFRSHIAARLLGAPLGSPLTPSLIGKLLLENCRSLPAHSRLIPFINKVDLEDGLAKAQILAKEWEIYKEKNIPRVVLGQTRNFPVVAEVYEAF